MSIELYLAFIVATVALVIIPGPNVALITANSVAYGRRYGLITVVGTSSAMVPQLALTIFGMTGVLAVTGELFEWIRWLGVAYLIFLGVEAIRAPRLDLTQVKPEPRSAGSIFWRGFLVSSTNPKTLLFYGAFFPQFITQASNIMPQLAILSLTFLIVATTLDCGWAILADQLRGILATKGGLRNRITGVFYFLAATGLASIKRTY